MQVRAGRRAGGAAAEPQVVELVRAPAPGRKWQAGILVAILVAAAALRLAARQTAPPGLNQDEAANAWNARCLLKTGTDQVGESWPLFYMRALGGNYTTLNIYLLIPFQALGGMNTWTTRAPAAIGGILAVFLAWYVGRRLVGPTVGLAAAALLAVSPWAVFNSRWGIEANLCPVLAIVPLAMLLAAGLPPAPREGRPPSVVLSLLAGLLTGICCYGYASIRLFVPAFVVGIVAVSWRQWWSMLKSRRGAIAVAAFVIGGAVTFGPLAWQHVAHPEGVSKRAKSIWIWLDPRRPDRQVPVSEKLSKVVGRYAAHYGPEFLFTRGDYSEIQTPPDMGQLHWYMLPLGLIGLGLAVGRCRRSVPARVLLVWLIVYPAGDVLSSHVVGGESSLHALRSSPGIAGFMLLGAVGAVGAGAWLWKRNRQTALAGIVALGLAVAGLNVRYYPKFFGEYNRRPFIYHKYHADLVELCRRMGPDLLKADAVFFTTMGDPPNPRFGRRQGIVPLNQPYIVALHELDYDPQQWFKDDPNFLPGEWDTYYRVGKLNFMYYVQRPGDRRVPWQAKLSELRANGRDDRVLFVLRPWELGAHEGLGPLGKPIAEVRRPDGVVVLAVYEKKL